MKNMSPNNRLQPNVFIPHHHVCQPSSTINKVRVVFDESCTMDSGRSLNDYLNKGPKLQYDIVNILNNF